MNQEHQVKMQSSQAIIAALKAGRLTRAEALSQLQALQQAAQSKTSPPSQTIEVAVVGMAGQFPDADDIDAFWQNLMTGHDPVKEVPEDRLNQMLFFDANKQPGKSYCKWGGVLEHRAAFDPLFFALSPREATSMSPSQRLFLTESYKALENAGISPDSLAGSECGVYVGCEPSGFQHLTFTGASEAIVAARISYLMNLQGPAFVVNTGCSSSASAIHLACEYLRSTDPNNPAQSTVITGGVFAALRDDLYIALSGAEMLSPKGVCRAFDAQADGTVISEGVGVLVLKRLNDALQDKNPILGIIAANGSNQDGKSNGITSPNGLAQQKLIEDTYAKFNIDAAQVSLFETHGTGTKIGDPIELNAMIAAFKPRAQESIGCAISSVKSNMGHAAAAAGVIGVIKVLLSLENKTLPGILHFNQLNPLIKLQGSPFHIQKHTSPWQPQDSNGQAVPRMAALNSFGHSGTNVHLVIREYQQAPRQPLSLNSQALPILLSARNDKQLQLLAKAMLARLSAQQQGQDDPLEIVLEQIAILWQLDCRDLVDVPLDSLGIDQVQLSELHQVLCPQGQPSFAEFLAATSIVQLAALLPKNNRSVALPLSDTELTDIAYTCAFGRKSLTQRAVLLAGDVDTLRTQLKQLSQGSALEIDAELLPDTVVTWRSGGKLDEQRLKQQLPVLEQGRLTRLPNYPFARKNYWPKPQVKALVKAQPLPTAQPVTSTPTLLSQQLQNDDGTAEFIGQFNATETFLQHHRIAGEPVFPGVAYLQLALEAAKRLMPNSQSWSLESVTFLQPLVVNKPRTVSILLHQTEQSYRFEVRSRTLEADSWQSHCQGRLVFTLNRFEALSPLALAQSHCLESVDVSQCYRDFAAADIRYGQTFTAITTLKRSDDGQLVLADIDNQASDEGWILPAGMTDAILQSVVGLKADSKAHKQTLLPFSIGSVNVFKSLPRQIKVVCRHHPDHNHKVARFDMDAFDLEGALCLQIRSFSARALNPAPVGKTAAVEPLFCAARQWQSWQDAKDTLSEQPYQAFYAADLGLSDNLEGNAADALTELLLNNYSAVKTHIEQRGSHAPLKLLCVIESAEEVAALCSFVGGFYQSLALEYPSISGSVIYCDSSCKDQAIAHAAQQTSSEEAAYRLGDNHQLQVQYRRLTLVDVSQAKASTFSGAVWLTGGLGGVGQEVVQHFAFTGAKALVLSGRRQLDSQGQQALADIAQRIAPLPVQYIACDCSDFAAVKQTITQIESRFGALDTIIHSAGVTQDGYIAAKTDEQVKAVLAAKLTSAINLHRACANLDAKAGRVRLVLFSSASSLLGNPGQSDYSAANRFLDAFAHWRSNKAPSVSINWPFWQNGGMQLDKAQLQAIEQQTGMAPLSTEAAMSALTLALNADSPQLLVASGDKEKFATMLKPLRSQATTAKTGADVNYVHQILIAAVAQVLEMEPSEIDLTTELEQFGLDSINFAELATLVSQRFELKLQPTIFFEYQTLAALAEFLAPQVSQPQSETTVVASAAIAAEPAATMSVPAKPETAEQEIAKNAQYRPQDIAIIGMSGRFPGAGHVDDFWQNLVDGVDAITEIPAMRWDWRAIFGDAKTQVNKTQVKWGGFIEDIDKFDALFFGISPKEAELIDPQQRLLFETVWLTMEDAGYRSEQLYGTATGIFAGTTGTGYAQLVHDADLPIEGYSSAGLVPSGGPNRMSFMLNLSGPSEPIESACSSALVAVHRAVQSLNAGECTMAFAGGVSSMVTPNGHISFSKAGMLSLDGRCKTFSAAADGYVRGEGVGFVLLKPLLQAQQDQDHIYAVIKGSAQNHGGKATSLTAPNPNAQAEVIEKALSKAEVSCETIGYIEAHGTGTALGDPIEINGLKKAFASAKPAYFGDGTVAKTFIGAVKTNIGHLEFSAGIAGLIKVVKAMNHDYLPGLLHLEQLNPYIELEGSVFEILREARPWPQIVDQNGALLPRRAGVSSFGFGGVNAHVVLEQYNHKTAKAIDVATLVLPLSAKQPSILADYVAKVRQWLEAQPEQQLADIAYSYQVGRDVFAQRALFVGRDKAELLTQLNAFDGGAKVYGDVTAVKHYQQWLDEGRFDWSVLYAQNQWPRRIPVPGYPFARVRHWIGSAKPLQNRQALYLAYPEHWPETMTEQLLSYAAEQGFDGQLVALEQATEDSASAQALLRNTQRLTELLQQGKGIRVFVQGDEHSEALSVAPLSALVKTARQELGHDSAQMANIAKDQLAAALALMQTQPDEAICYVDAQGKAQQPYLSLAHQMTQQELTEHSIAPWFDPEGVTVITGGLGGIATALLKQLVNVNSGSFLLLGRSEPTDEQLQWLALHPQLEYLAVDIQHKADLAKLYQRLAQVSVLNGIIHCAGSLRDGLLKHKKAADIEAVFAAKVLGLSQLLEGLTQTPQFVLLMSSTSGLFGNAGQGDYAVANAFLDNLAQISSETRLLSINWPLWQDGGMQLSDTQRQQLTKATGLVPLEADAALAAILWGLSYTPAKQLLVLSGQVAKMADTFGFDAQSVKDNEATLVLAPAFYIEQGSEDITEAQVAQKLQQFIAEKLKIAAQDLAMDSTLEGYGVDSVMALDLSAALEQRFGELPKTLFFEYQTLSELAEYFIAQHHKALVTWLGVNNAPKPRQPAVAVELPVVQTATSRHEAITSKAATSGSAVAIIGISGQFAGASNLEAFWQNLVDGVDSLSKAPAHWVLSQSYADKGGFMEDVDCFDSLFFNLSPNQAKVIDPQERLMLQSIWHTLEDAGYHRGHFEKRNEQYQVGVFVASMYQQYSDLLRQDSAEHGAAMLWSYSSMANRVSQFFNFKGPSIAVDTMCSGATTAIDMACGYIQSGALKTALVGAVNLNLHPNKFVGLSMGQMLSNNGMVEPFGLGNGYLPGEGVASVMLKSLDLAEQDNDQVYGVIRASHINHAGKTSGFSVPDMKAQARLISDNLKAAGLNIEDIDYIESAANGAEIGDQLELAALKKVFAPLAQKRPIGSVKGNIGHGEAVSGLTQLAKVLWQFRHHRLAPMLHADKVNPALNFASSPFEVVAEVTDWPTPVIEGKAKPLTAAITSIGAGGSNAHLLVSEYLYPPVASEQVGEQWFVLSAKTEQALREYVARYCAYLPLHPSIRFEDVIYTVQQRREHMPYRLAVKVSSITQLVEQLSDWLAQGEQHLCITGKAGDEVSATQCQGQLWVCAKIDGFEHGSLGRVTRLPGYPFAKVRHWPDEALLETEQKSIEVNNQVAEPGTDLCLQSLDYEGVKTLYYQVLMQMLGLDAAQIEADKGLFHYGADSIMLLRLSNRLSDRLGVPADIKILAQTTIAQSIDYLLKLAQNPVASMTHGLSDKVGHFNVTLSAERQVLDEQSAKKRQAQMLAFIGRGVGLRLQEDGIEVSFAKGRLTEAELINEQDTIASFADILAIGEAWYPVSDMQQLILGEQAGSIDGRYLSGDGVWLPKVDDNGVGEKALFNKAMLQQAITATVNRHSGLRVNYHLEAQENEPVIWAQNVKDRFDEVAKLQEIALHGAYSEQAFYHKLNATLTLIKNRAFNLSQGPLWRFYLIHNRSDKAMLFFHGVHLDGLSSYMLSEEILQQYQAKLSDTSAALLPVQLNVGEAVLAQMAGFSEAEDRQFEQVYQKVTALSSDSPLPKLDQAMQHTIELSPCLVEKLQAAQRVGYTLTELVGSAYMTALKSQPGHDVLNMVVNRRLYGATENLIGDFSNALPLIAPKGEAQVKGEGFNSAPLTGFKQALAQTKEAIGLDTMRLRYALAGRRKQSVFDPRVFGRYGFDSIDRSNMASSALVSRYELAYDKLPGLFGEQKALLDLLLVMIRGQSDVKLLFSYNSAALDQEQTVTIANKVITTLETLADEVRLKDTYHQQEDAATQALNALD